MYVVLVVVCVFCSPVSGWRLSWCSWRFWHRYLHCHPAMLIPQDFSLYLLYVCPQCSVPLFLVCWCCLQSSCHLHLHIAYNSYVCSQMKLPPRDRDVIPDLPSFDYHYRFTIATCNLYYHCQPCNFMQHSFSCLHVHSTFCTFVPWILHPVGMMYSYSW